MAETPPRPDNGVPRYTDQQVDEIIANRAIIDQASGVLMHIYGVAAAEAFDMLRSRARGSRVTVRQLAEQILIYPRLAETLWD
jgi:AmiR/NasT family two-component response regulator